MSYYNSDDHDIFSLENILYSIIIGAIPLLIILSLIGCSSIANTIAPVERRIVDMVPGEEIIDSVDITYNKGCKPPWFAELCLPLGICFNGEGETIEETFSSIKIQVDDVCKRGIENAKIED
jgi:hypothetical protein